MILCVSLIRGRRYVYIHDPLLQESKIRNPKYRKLILHPRLQYLEYDDVWVPGTKLRKAALACSHLLE
jgi:hypothetical protein